MQLLFVVIPLLLLSVSLDYNVNLKVLLSDKNPWTAVQQVVIPKRQPHRDCIIFILSSLYKVA